jgi:hypothetical protein
LSVHRLFMGEMANEIAWLLLAALFVVAFGMYLAVRRSLDRSELCVLTMWGCWLTVTAMVLSYMDRPSAVLLYRNHSGAV